MGTLSPTPLQGNIVKVAGFSASTNVIWTPTAGKKARIFTCQVIVPGTCVLAAQNDYVITLQDGGTVLWLWGLVLGNAATAGNLGVFYADFLPSGIQCQSNVQILCTTSLTAGQVSASIFGTEE